MIPRWQQVQERRGTEVSTEALFPRIEVRPPYFALSGLRLAGLELRATASAESPPYDEQGPMPAAELGRHAAIVGLSAAALQQRDDDRRYYLARSAECRYAANTAPYGTPVRFTGRVVELDKRTARASVEAVAAGGPLASFDLRYTVLTSSAFERLFKVRARPTPQGRSPYGSLLTTAWQGDADAAEQFIDALPAEACVGHFDGYPALPVAVLMGQLSYLAGRLHGDPFRVVRGEVEASDLVWAGERASFRAKRDGRAGDETLGGAHRYRCEASAGDRVVAGMTLWLSSVGAARLS